MDKVYASGMYIKQRVDNTPDYVIANVSFRVDDFIEFLQKHQNDKGWVNLTMFKNNKGGSDYTQLRQAPPSTPEPVEEPKHYNKGGYIKPEPVVPEFDDNMPF